MTPPEKVTTALNNTANRNAKFAAYTIAGREFMRPNVCFSGR
jgi:hypothetical protein